MFGAVCDPAFRRLNVFLGKIVTPFSFPIKAVRFSHSTPCRKGDFFPSVKYRCEAHTFTRTTRCLLCSCSRIRGKRFPPQCMFHSRHPRPSALP